MKEEKIKKVIKKSYGKIAKGKGFCCGPKKSSCCETTGLAENISKNIGYTDEELQSVPDGANLGLGCGNPVALASLKEGEIVLDLGSGAGFDCLLAANKVGKAGKVIGIDMTPEMIKKAKKNAKKGGYENVEFKLGEVENLPVADNSADIVISNCVINLSPDKKKVFREIFRVLKPGGRFMVSDIVLLKELPETIKNSIESYVGCIAGAMMKDDYIKTIKEAGFQNVKIIDETVFSIDMLNGPDVKELIKNLNIPIDTMKEIVNSGVSIKIQGMK